MSRAERSPYRLAAYALVTAVVLLAAIPGYLLLQASWRPVALRLGSTALVVIVGTRLVGRVRRSLERAPASALDAAPPAPRPPAQDERFLRLRDDLLFSTRSRHYFEAFLWPRLARLGVAGAPPPPPPRGRRRRGPSLAELDRLVTEAERRA
jgi:hypothetical protein